MSLRPRLLSATLLTLCAAPAAAQDFVNFDNYCTTGAFQVCASVRVILSADGRTVQMQVWNLEGFIGEPGTLTAIALYHTDPTLEFMGNVTAFNVDYVTASETRDVTDYWVVDPNDIENLGGIRLELAAGAEQGHKGGIVGCTDPSPPQQQEDHAHVSTCMSFPDKPYVLFTFQLDEAFSSEALLFRWHAQQLGPDGEGSIKCEPSREPGDEYHCAVIPEPFTTLLLGSGLAGLGGVGFLRRRRKRGDISDD